MDHCGGPALKASEEKPLVIPELVLDPALLG